MRKQPKPKKCSNCAGEFIPFNTTQVVCSPVCAAELAKKKREKKEKRDWVKTKREMKEKIKTLSDYMNEVQKEFNTFIRLSKKPVCISCGINLKGRKFDAGHYRSVGNAPSLRFDHDNVWPQCVKCNRDLHGNLIEYRITLVTVIGEDRVKELEREQEPKNYTIPELKELKSKYKRLVKELR